MGDGNPQVNYCRLNLINQKKLEKKPTGNEKRTQSRFHR